MNVSRHFFSFVTLTSRRGASHYPGSEFRNQFQQSALQLQGSHCRHRPQSAPKTPGRPTATAPRSCGTDSQLLSTWNFSCRRNPCYARKKGALHRISTLSSTSSSFHSKHRWCTGSRDDHRRREMGLRSLCERASGQQLSTFW